MSFQERNMYQVFLIGICRIDDGDFDGIFRLGQIFADLEAEFSRCPTPWEVVRCVSSNPKKGERK